MSYISNNEPSNQQPVSYPFKSKHEPGSSQYIRQVLALLCEADSVYELRALKTRYGTISGYYDDLDRMAEDAADLSGKVPNVYFTINPCLPDLLARACNRFDKYVHNTTEDDHIIKRRWFLVDVDPIRPAGISATDAEKALAFEVIQKIRDYLRSKDSSPGILADSGNGYHLILRNNYPNDKSTTELYSKILNSLAQQFDSEPDNPNPKFEPDNPKVKIDGTVFNASRIWKLYGTLAAKGDSLITRPHRYAKLLEVWK